MAQYLVSLDGEPLGASQIIPEDGRIEAYVDRDGDDCSPVATISMMPQRAKLFQGPNRQYLAIEDDEGFHHQPADG